MAQWIYLYFLTFTLRHDKIPSIESRSSNSTASKSNASTKELLMTWKFSLKNRTSITRLNNKVPLFEANINFQKSNLNLQSCLCALKVKYTKEHSKLCFTAQIYNWATTLLQQKYCNLDYTNANHRAAAIGFNRRVQYPTFFPFIKWIFHFSINLLFSMYFKAILDNSKGF